MCEFEMSAYIYKGCKLSQYGRTVAPHKIFVKTIHGCTDPKPAHGSDERFCDERLHKERRDITDEADRGHSRVNEDCPACKAADDKCLEIYHIPNPSLGNATVATAKPDMPQPLTQNPAEQGLVADRSRVAEVVTDDPAKPRRRSRQIANSGRSHPSHGRHKGNEGCVIF